ncbi:MAG: hypothetical protein RIQ40_655 [Planctomycetota bacterium]
MPRALRVLVDRVVLIGAAVMLVGVIALAASGSSIAAKLGSSLLLLAVGWVLLRTSLQLRAPILHLLGWAGAVAAAGFIVITQAWVWGLFAAGNADRFVQWVLSCSLAAFAAFVCDVAVLHRVVLHGMFARIVRGAAIAAMGVLLGGVALWCILGSISSMPAMRTPLWPLVTIVCLATHVAMPLLARADARRERARVAAAHDRALATLQCVRCGQWMQMHSGKAACPRCKSIITLEFEEPRCECGYPLHRLNSANCPECGTDIPAEKRWLGGAPPAATLTPSST